MATRWYPDTCKCVLDFEMDGGQPVLKKFISKCSYHAHLDDQIAFATVMAENKERIKRQ